MGLGVDNALVCPSRCAVIPAGPDPNAALTEGFFELAARQNPRSTTAALVSVDAEFFRNPVLGAKANAGKRGTEVVHESTSPLPTGDFKTVVDAVTEAGGSLFRIERAGEKPAPHDARCSGKSLSRRHADVR